MNRTRVAGMILRNLYVWVRDLDRVFDAFWWAFFDVVVWGFMSTYFARGTGQSSFVAQFLSGIILWSVLARSQWEVSASMLLESWEKNLINIFTTPLTVGEFVVASVLLGLGKLVIVFFFMGAVTWVFFQFNVFVMSWWIVPFLASIFFTSVWVSLVVNALILRWGKRVMTFAWTLVLLINPVSGVVYPLSALPAPLQAIARLLPTSYVFEGMRQVLSTGTTEAQLIFVSFALNTVYLIGSVAFYLATFRRAQEHGWLIKLA